MIVLEGCSFRANGDKFTVSAQKQPGGCHDREHHNRRARERGRD